MKISLYFAPFSCALVPYVMLTQTGADFDVRPLNIRGKENMSPEYLAMNPKHKVPLLLVDDKPLSENVAIQLWIAEQFPGAGLLPKNPWEKAQAVSLCAWFASGIHPHISRYNSPQKFCDHPGSEDSTRKLAKEMLIQQFKIAEAQLESKPLFFDYWTAPDVYLFWCFRRANLFDFDLSQFKNIRAHSDRLGDVPAVGKAIAFDETVIKSFNLQA